MTNVFMEKPDSIANGTQTTAAGTPWSHTFTKIALGVGLLMCLFLVLTPAAQACSAGCFGSDGSGAPPSEPPPCNGSCCQGDGEGDCTDDQGEGGGCDTSGQPVELSSGRELITQTDLTVSGVRRIRMVRKYDSQSEYDSPMGYGWALTLDKRLYKYADGSVIVRSNCGFRRKYTFTGNAYQAPIGEAKTLTEQSDGSFILESPSGFREYYDVQGKLIANEDAKGNRLELHYVDSDADGRADRLPLIGSSPYAVDPSVPMVVSMGYRLSRIEERLASGTLTGIAVDLSYNNDTGRLASITANDGRSVTYEHDTSSSEFNGNLIKVNGLDGITGIYTYDDRDAAGDVQDGHNVTTFQHDDSLAAYINVYNEEGQVVRQSHGSDVREYSYTVGVTSTVTHTVSDDQGAPLTRLITTLNFDENNYTESKTNALYTYNSETNSFDLDVIYRTEQDRNSQASVIAERWYEQAPGAAEATLVRSKTYDYNSELKKTLEAITLDSGETITKTWGYDQGRRTFAQVVSDARPNDFFRSEYTYNYDSEGRPTTRKTVTRYIDADTALTTTYTYDDVGRILTTTLPDDHQLINVYSADTREDPQWLGTKLTRTYQQSGDTALPQLAQRFSYDAQGNLAIITDARNQPTRLIYDSKNRMVERINALQESMLYRYTDDLLSEVEIGATTAAGEGQVSRFGYTSKGEPNKVERKNDAGQWITVSTSTFNSAGQPLTQTRYINGNALTISYAYDALGRLVGMTDYSGIKSAYTYDVMGNRTRTATAVGTDSERQNSATYDDLNRLTQTVSDAGNLKVSTYFTYNAVGDLLTVTDPKNSITTYTYDGLSRQTQIKQPLNQTLSYTYTDRGQVATVINARAQTMAYRYEDWGALKAIDYYEIVEGSDTPSVVRTVSYTYDDSGNLLTVADTDINDGANLYTYTYDALSRNATTAVGYLANLALSQEYNRFGHRDSLTLTDDENHTHSFVYNKLNELATATLPGNQAWTPSYHSDAGLMASLKSPSGIVRKYQYNMTTGLLDQIQTRNSDDSALEQWDYNYDTHYNIDAIISLRDAGTTTYGYDTLDRLTSADHPSQTDESYSYDLVGNRTNTDYIYNANHQITQSPGAITYTFDADGNITSKSGGYTYTHNANNRFTGFTDSSNPENNASYVYDPFGRRIAKTVNGATTYFVWDGSQLIAEYNQSGARTKRYAYLPGSHAPVQVEDSSGIVYDVHVDHLDTPKFMTNANQAIVWSQVQTSFGETTVNDDVDGDGKAVVFNVRFPGQYWDEETQTSYNYFRNYDPSLGRYLQSDPIGLQGGINTYGYVFQNPLSLFDIFGLEVIGTWSKKPDIDVNSWLRRDPSKCTGKNMGDCYFNGRDAGLGVDIYFWVEVLVSNGLLKCEDTETCENWTVETQGFYDAVDFTVTAANPGLACSGAGALGGLRFLPLACPAVFASSIYSSLGQYRKAMLEGAKQYIADLTPEVRASICKAGRR